MIKRLVLTFIILFFTSPLQASEPSKYKYSGSEKIEALDQKKDDKKGGVFAGSKKIVGKGGHSKNMEAPLDVCETPSSSPDSGEKREEPNFSDTESRKSKSTKKNGVDKTSNKQYLKNNKTSEEVSSQNQNKKKQIQSRLKDFFKRKKQRSN